MKNLLPNKLSDCIDVALKDLDAAKKLGFKVNMGNWYRNEGKTCTVCLAGAVMAREFDLDKYEDAGPATLFLTDNLISEHDYDRLHALNLVREGLVVEALARLDDVPEVWPANTLTMLSTGNTDTKAWRKDMLNIRDYLREQGL
jgi:hypothetical protein